MAQGRWAKAHWCKIYPKKSSLLTTLLLTTQPNESRANLLHFRSNDNIEVDFVLERPDGTLAGIEVKTVSRVDSSDFSGLKTLKEAAKDDFICGVVLYRGNEVVPFDNNLLAVPLSSLWQ